MKLIGYELYKLGTKRSFLILVSILFCLNLFVCIRSLPNQMQQDMTLLIRMAEKEPDRASVIAQEITEQYENAYFVPNGASMQEQMQITAQVYPGTYGDTLREDFRYATAYSEHKAYIENFSSSMQTLVENSRFTLKELNTQQNFSGFSVQLQEKLIDTYSMTSRIPVTFADTLGWDGYFSYDGLSVFLFLVAMLICTEIFSPDSLRPISFAAKFGRRHLLLARLSAVCILNGIFCLVFSISSLLVFGLSCGLCDPLIALQSIPTFQYCPFNLTILGYAVISLLLRYLVLTVFSVLLVFFCLLVRPIFAYAVGILLIGVNYLLAIAFYADANHPLRILNFYFVSDPQELFLRLLCFNFGDTAVPYFWIMLPLYFVLFLLFSILCFPLFYVSKADTRSFSLQKRIKKILKADVLSFRWIPKTLCGWEMYKSLFSGKMLLVAIVLLFVCFYQTDRYYVLPDSVAQQMYYEYTTELEGPWSMEKMTYLREEQRKTLQQLQDAVLRKEQFRYTDTDAYLAAIRTETEAELRSEVLLELIQNGNMLQQVQQKSSATPWFLFDREWTVYFAQQPDLILFLLTVLFCSGLFADEFRVGIVPIQRVTKKGRRPVFRAKIRYACGVGAVGIVSYRGLNLFFALTRFTLPASSAPLNSLPMFSSFSGTMTIGQFTVWSELLQIVLWVCFAVGIALLSLLIRKRLIVMVSVCLVGLIPTVLRLFNFDLFDSVDLMKFLRCVDFARLSFDMDFLGYDFGYGLFGFVLFVLVCMITCFSCKHLWERM